MAFHSRVFLSYGGGRAMFNTKLEFDGQVARMVRDTTASS